MIHAAMTMLRVTYNARRSPKLPADSPLVTVIIPTYNWSSVLRYAIESALWQTYPAVEVVVVGDACTDDSEDVVASFGDPRVRWHNLAENSGSQSVPNNVGLDLARGEYVAYLGHDDIWLPTHLALLMETVRRTGAKIAHTRCEYVSPTSGFRKLRGGPPPSAVLHEKQLGRELRWRHYREIADAPDADFIKRVAERGGGLETVQKLTVFKFPSAWRRNSYVDKPFHQQQAYARRITRERFFVYREIAAVAWSRLRRLHDPMELPAAPSPMPPGWHVTQLRKLRGLE